MIQRFASWGADHMEAIRITGLAITMLSVGIHLYVETEWVHVIALFGAMVALSKDFSESCHAAAGSY